MTSTLSNTLTKLGATPKMLDIIRLNFKHSEVKRNKYFCRKGARCEYLGILDSGLLKAIYINDSEKEQISRFFYTPDNIIVTNFASFTSKEITTETIQAIEDSILLVISKNELDKLYKKYPEINRLGRLIAEDSYIKALQRIHDLQTLSSKARRDKFINNGNPELLKRLPKQDIASYLGMHRNYLTKK